MKIKITNSEEFSRLLEVLTNETVTACIHFRLYSDLEAARPTYAVEFNESWTFWWLTFQSHLDTTLFRLCKIYEPHPESLNLPNLLNIIKENAKFFDEGNFRERLKGNPFVDSLASSLKKPDLIQLQKDIAFVNMKSNPLVNTLVMWRHKFFAHRSAGYVVANKSLADQYPFNMIQVDQLLKEAIRILNRYSILFQASSYSTQIIGHDDYRHVLKSIRSALLRHEEEIAHELEHLKSKDS
ncbi:hypothetical protein [Methylobacter tundripaludum]|uniref:HEPN AbiU2-like domain-containing protein n=1 Tax=Methylobacter tundripaludum (strain ATCC BAA-1195 / DSM 17260 / SV96) TaxID=697282 RepID=G3IUZ3_METTV|nr:hypothetical protein [Methylobacter tundripaludum]EGW22789.1 hypothetical protein Mettu_1613 [Methylobacter tundripaludum SV96]